MLLGISMYWTVHTRSFYTPVLHLHVPVRPPSQTHKFLKGSTNLFLHASIWMQKITMIMIMSFPLLTGHLTGCGNMDLHDLLIST